MKLKEKRREGGKYHKSYFPAQTPAERLLAWKGLSKDKRAWIKKMQREQDPFELHQRVETKLRVLWKIVREAQGEEDGEATAVKTAEGWAAHEVLALSLPALRPRSARPPLRDRQRQNLVQCEG